MKENNVIQGDCLDILGEIEENKADMIYLDPPFFTQEKQKLVSSKTNKEYIFNDTWNSMDEYLSYMKVRLIQCRRVLKKTGSIFVHCDRNASHYLKVLLDKIFGSSNFQSEIIWSYKRWSNSKKGLLNNHQVILFYSKTSNFKFNRIYTDYSETTNIDQILQERVRNEKGKAVYKYNADGDIVIGQSKKGVPLSDVWEIPYLNPKAKERVGYPTQKPILLLEQILRLVTDEGDFVIDPFAGSGTTVVAAKMLKRKYLGIDILPGAVELTEHRLESLIKTESVLLKKGKKAYQNLSDFQMDILKHFQAVPVQRNSGIDGFLKEYIDGQPVSIKIQKEDESFEDALSKMIKAGTIKKCCFMVLVRTHMDEQRKFLYHNVPENVIVIDSYELQNELLLEKLHLQTYSGKICVFSKERGLSL